MRRVRVSTLNSGSAMSITYYECVSVALVTQQAMRMCHIIICALSGSKDLPHYLINSTSLIKRLLNTKCVF